MRRDYEAGPLHRSDLQADPFRQFDRWFSDAAAAGLSDPNAMVLATVDANGQPSQRIVLLKQIDHGGFVFFTNLQSPKGRALAVHPQASLLFPWHMLDRQVIIQGSAQRTTREEDAAYFASRPRASRIAAWVSQQSAPIASREALDAAYAEREHTFGDREVPLPDGWGGFRLMPARFEFWQGRPNRLHDRFMYTPSGSTPGHWDITRLQP